MHQSATNLNLFLHNKTLQAQQSWQSLWRKGCLIPDWGGDGSNKCCARSDFVRLRKGVTCLAQSLLIWDFIWLFLSPLSSWGFPSCWGWSLSKRWFSKIFPTHISEILALPGVQGVEAWELLPPSSFPYATCTTNCIVHCQPSWRALAAEVERLMDASVGICLVASIPATPSRVAVRCTRAALMSVSLFFLFLGGASWWEHLKRYKTLSSPASQDPPRLKGGVGLHLLSLRVWQTKVAIWEVYPIIWGVISPKNIGVMHFQTTTRSFYSLGLHITLQIWRTWKSEQWNQVTLQLSVSEGSESSRYRARVNLAGKDNRKHGWNIVSFPIITGTNTNYKVCRPCLGRLGSTQIKQLHTTTMHSKEYLCIHLTLRRLMWALQGAQADWEASPGSNCSTQQVRVLDNIRASAVSPRGWMRYYVCHTALDHTRPLLREGVWLWGSMTTYLALSCIHVQVVVLSCITLHTA